MLKISINNSMGLPLPARFSDPTMNKAAKVSNKSKVSNKKSQSLITVVVLAILPFVVLLVSLAIGSYSINPIAVCKIIVNGITGAVQQVPEATEGIDAMASKLIWQVRLPRALAALLVGAALSMAGAVFQGIFRNPLASPYTLGVSNGAGFGAGLGILMGFAALQIQGMSIAFGLLSIGLAILVSARSKHTTVTLILSGMLIGSLFASLISLLKFVADPTERLPQIVYWIMGTLSGVNFEKLLMILPLYVAGAVTLLLFRWRLNILSMGDQEAASFGVSVKRDRIIIIIAASVLAALATSISGIIGWVGIVVPHLARMLVGPDYRRLLLVSASLGACYLLIIDNICRTASASEIPIGIITGIIGVPMFLYFIYRKKVGWS